MTSSQDGGCWAHGPFLISMYLLQSKFSKKKSGKLEAHMLCRAGVDECLLSKVLAGPSVGQFLAELGADVVKAAHPGIINWPGFESSDGF